MTKITTIASLLDSWLGDIDPETGKVHYPFGWRIGCVKMASPRHERFDLVRDVGSLLVDQIFNNQSLSDGHLTFVFPERHMSVHEQQAFTHALTKHKDAGKITQVDMITSSPLIIGSFNRECIRILSWEDDHLHNGQINY